MKHKEPEQEEEEEEEAEEARTIEGPVEPNAILAFQPPFSAPLLRLLPRRRVRRRRRFSQGY